MNRRLIYSILLSFVCGISALFAQGVSVESFRLLENDLTANTHGTMEKDFNGETAALIKVMTTEQGFVFDGGMVGIVKVRQEVSEIFVYVPHGIKKMSIKHPQLGMIRDYYFPVSIEKARTYEMRLTTGKVETIVTRSAGKQYVMFNVTPANAIVELDGMPLEVVDGYAEKSMPYGTYDYRVSCADYHTEAGKLTVSSAGKVEKNISLRPNFGWIDIKGSSEHHGAQVYLDNKHIGQLPLKSDAVKSGIYQIKVLKPLYKPYEQSVTVTDNNTTTLNVALVPNFANITLTTDAESEIWVDGRQRGKGQCTLNLELGEYTVEVKRPSHRTVSDVIHVAELTDRTIQLASPTPIYGVLDISSSPSRATVLVDGVEMGQTPLILDDLLVGNHELLLIKEGYIEQSKTISVIEENIEEIGIVLSEKPKEVMVNVSSNVKRAMVRVDGEEIGETPISIPMKVGAYDFYASKKGYQDSYVFDRVIGVASNNVFLPMQKVRKEIPRYNESFEVAVDFYAGYCPAGLEYGMYMSRTFLFRAINSGLYFDFNVGGNFSPCWCLGVGLGWSFLCGKRFVLIPQVRGSMHLQNPEKYSADAQFITPYSLRVLYCLDDFRALSVMTEYGKRDGLAFRLAFTLYGKYGQFTP